MFKLLGWLREAGIPDIVDILFVSLLIYTVLVWFKKTRSAFVLIGLLIFGAVYLFASAFNLVLTTAVFQGFFAIILVAVIIIFQEEIRHFFEQVAVWSMERRLMRPKTIRPARQEIEVLVRSLTEFARERTGALVVIKGRDMILRHLEGGVDLNGKMSDPLLRSLFNRHSPAHDGALIVEGGTITRFSCHLPLSRDVHKLQTSGTRHAAALGLAELSDALCLVVSEERGTISAARSGSLQKIEDPEKLTRLLESFYKETDPEKERRSWQDFFKKNSSEKVVAFAMAVMLWFVLVNGSKLVYRTFTVPVGYANLPADVSILKITPAEVDLTFWGQRRDFYFLNAEGIRIFLKTYNLKSGIQSIPLSASNVRYPKQIVLENIEPRRVRVEVASKMPKVNGNGKKA